MSSRNRTGIHRRALRYSLLTFVVGLFVPSWLPLTALGIALGIPREYFGQFMAGVYLVICIAIAYFLAWIMTDQAAPPAPASTYVETSKVVANRRTAIYHRPDCEWAQKISFWNAQGFDSQQKAEAAGYRGCYECDP